MTNAESVKKCYQKHKTQRIQAARAYRRKYPKRSYLAVRKYQKKNPERIIFWMIVQRCHNPNNKDYYLYGGRGIKCLFESYDEFISEIGPRPSNKYSVDRIDNDSHYEPGNIRWATAKQQANNRRKSL